MSEMKTEIIVIAGHGAQGPWEGCINSVNYRIERGVPVEVPCEVAAVIRNAEKERRAGEARVKNYVSAGAALI